MIRDSDGTPVMALQMVGMFPSKAAAARHFGVTRSHVYEAVENGHQCKGVWFRYSDMPAKFQPLRDARETPVVRVHDGVMFKSKSAVIGDAAPAVAQRSNEWHREWMRLSRSIERGVPYCGHVYRLATVKDLSPAKVGAK